MIPVLFHIGPLPVNTFGLMMVLCFFVAWYRLLLTLEENQEDSALAEPMVVWAAVGGIVGARILYVLSFPAEFQSAPWRIIFSSAGFIFYGGLVGGALAVVFLLWNNGKRIVRYADYVSPSLALGYAIGRIGCQLSGDGDYGSQSTLPWAMSYVNGIVPTPSGILVHPAPVYETLLALGITFILIRSIRNSHQPNGQVFLLYLFLSSLARFMVEFLRVEPIVSFGLTQAQIFAAVMGLVGLSVYLIRRLRFEVPSNSA